MPYIAEPQRWELDDKIDELLDVVRNARQPEGAFNYVITRIAIDFFKRDRSYRTGNAVMGVLDCAAKEFYRRHLAPYEDAKRLENGDVD